MKLSRTWMAPVAALVLAAMAMLPAAGCGGDSGQADRMVKEADELRVSAADRFRRSTAAMDGLVKSAAASQTLPVNQTRAATQTASDELTAALGELTLRDAKLGEAGALDLSDSYREYLALLRQSNNRLSETMNMAMEIPTLLKQEEYTVAGWDEIKTEIIVSQIRTMQGEIQAAFEQSELLRNRAEQLKKDNGGDF